MTNPPTPPQSTSPLGGMPAPPAAPGAADQTYGYPNLGPTGGQFMTIPQDGSTSTGEVDEYLVEIGESGIPNPLAWFDKQVTYINEVRFFNTFRSERRPQYDKRTETKRRTGEFKTRRENGMCWREEQVLVDVHVEMAYSEYQRYEIWTINQSQEAYYEFVTGFGGTTVDASIDLPAAAAGARATAAAGAAAAGARAAQATGAAAAEGVTLSAGAARLALASKALGVVGTTYLMFQVFTGAWVAFSGGTKNAAGDLTAEGWDYIRTYHADSYDEPTVTTWEAVEEPHPCSDAENDQTGYVPSGFSEWVRAGVRSGRVKVLTLITCGGVILGVAAATQGGGGDPDTTPTPTPAVAAATVTGATDATATVEAVETPVAIDAEPGPGQILVFRLDGVDFFPDGLVHTDAHVPNCEYQHVHGGPITSVLPGPDGRPLIRTEHLGDCGFGPPNFYLIPDPR